MIRLTIATALSILVLGCSGSVSSFTEKLSGNQASGDATAADSATAATTAASGDAATNGAGADSASATDGGAPGADAGITVAVETTAGTATDASVQPASAASAASPAPSPSPSASPKAACKRDHDERGDKERDDKGGHALVDKDDRAVADKDDKDECDKDRNDKEDADDKGECARNLGVKFERLRLSGKGSEKVFDLKEGDGYVAKATGNKTKMVLNIAARKDAAKLKALCLIAGGNQVQILVDTAASIEAIHFIGRGNGAIGHVNVQKGAEVTKVTSDLKGNGASFKIEGDGKYPK